MYYFFLFASLISSYLFSSTVATTENEPSAFVDGVNVITGNLYLLENDLTVQGAEPIHLQRNYVSQKGEGYWNMFPYHRAFIDFRKNVVEIIEPSGARLYYKWKTKYNSKGKAENKFYDLNPNEKDSKGLANTARGKPSGKTNLKNQTVHLGSDHDRLSVICPDGTRRVYVQELLYDVEEFMDWNITSLPYGVSYLLVKEELPNGRQIRYHWPRDKKDKWEIVTCDKERKYVYSWVKFYPHNGKNPKTGKKDISHGDYGLETSDGRHMELSFFTHNKVHQLKEVTRPEKPKQTYQYSSYKKKKLLTSIISEEGRFQNIVYYTPSSSLDEQSDLCFRVKELKAPVGPQGEEIVTRRFSYDLNEKKTTAFDCDGIPTEYFWNDDLRLIKINRFSAPGVLSSQERFLWGANGSQDASNLLCKIILDGNEKPLFATRYFYDKKGNVEKETIYGNLTGRCLNFELNDNGFPKSYVENYSKHFTYSDDEKSLLLSEKEDSGLSISYSYLSGTDLLTSQVFYAHGIAQKEKTYTYDPENGVLTQESTKDLQGNLHIILQIFPKSGFKVEKEKSEYRYPKLPSRIEEYHGDGNLVSETKLLYTTGGKLLEKQTYANSPLRQNLRLSRYEYYRGNQITEIDFFGNRKESTYDVFNNLSSFKDFGGRTTNRFQYDLANRPLSSEEEGEGLSQSVSCKYNNRGDKIEAYDFYHHKTSYEYDSFGNNTKLHLPSGGTLSMEYDSRGNQTLLIDPNGNQTRTSYNAYNKPTEVLYPDGTSEHFFYSLRGTLDSYIDQDGMQTDFIYDLFGRLISKKTPFSEETLTYDSFNLLSETDAEGRVTTYTYDKGGRLISQKKGEEVINYSYDRLGRVHHTTFGDLSIIKEHNPLDQVVQERKLDAQGNLLQIEDYRYDTSGNLVSLIRNIGGSQVEETQEFDALKRLKSVKNALNEITQYEYDDERHRQTVRDPLGSQTIETFNESNKVSSLEKVSASGKLLFQELYSYDLCQNLKEKQIVAENASQTSRWDYDPMHRILCVKEAANSPLEKTTSYSYNSKGLLFQVIKPRAILTHVYDPLGHLERQFSSDGTIDYTYEHDKTGLLKKSTDELSGAHVSRSYTPQGRVKKENLSGFSFKSSYDLQGRKTLLELPDHSSISYEYDALHLRKVSKQKEGKTLYSHKYLSYDLSGNLLDEMPIHGSTSTSHSYDALGRHVEVKSPYFHEVHCAFDLAGNLIHKKRNGELFSYTYDDLYQLSSEKNHTYTYDAFKNRTEKDGVQSSSNELNQTSELSYTEHGTPLSYEEKTLKYDALDRLISVKDASKKILYSYDSFHRRLSKKVFDKESNQLLEHVSYLYDLQNEIGAFDHLSEKIVELRVLGSTHQAERSSAIALELYGKTYMPIHDLQGNIATLIPLQDGPLETFNYSSFGEEETSSLNPWRFSSKRVDPETGFVFFGRRHYLPKLGRWLTPDPLGLSAGPNVYAFLSNSPLMRFDLYGLIDWGHDVENILYDIETSKDRAIPLFPRDLKWEAARASRPGTFSVGPKDTEDYHIFFVNGILTKLGEAVDYAKLVSEYAGGAPVRGIYNNKKRFGLDFLSAAIGALGIRRHPSDLLEEELLKFMNKHPNSSEKALIVCHSDGATHVYEFLKRFKEYENRVIVLAIAPATVITKDLCFKSNNYRSKDIVPFLRPIAPWLSKTNALSLLLSIGFKSRDFESLKELEYLEPLTDGWMIHSFSNVTFKSTLESKIAEYLNERGNWK